MPPISTKWNMFECKPCLACQPTIQNFPASKVRLRTAKNQTSYMPFKGHRCVRYVPIYFLYKKDMLLLGVTTAMYFHSPVPHQLWTPLRKKCEKNDTKCLPFSRNEGIYPGLCIKIMHTHVHKLFTVEIQIPHSLR
jgi:hypothetical protein